MQDLMDAGLPLPAVNQIEFHPYWHQVRPDILLCFPIAFQLHC